MTVSCIMPTCRPEMLPRAIGLFIRQDYKDKQLVIIGDAAVYNLIPAGHIIKHVFVPDNPTVGTKRNKGCLFADGEIILHLDDDDFYASDWISHSVKHLIESRADMTGINQAWFYQPHTNLWEYKYNGKQPYVIGASMCYWKRVWERRKFKDINEGEDAIFCGNAGKVVPHNYQEGFVAMIHGNNTASHKQLSKMTTKPVELAKGILGKDYSLY